MSNPFNIENPFKKFTVEEQKRKDEEDYLEWLDAAVRYDPEGKTGEW